MHYDLCSERIYSFFISQYVVHHHSTHRCVCLCIQLQWAAMPLEPWIAMHSISTSIGQELFSKKKFWWDPTAPPPPQKKVATASNSVALYLEIYASQARPQNNCQWICHLDILRRVCCCLQSLVKFMPFVYAGKLQQIIGLHLDYGD